MPVEHSLAGGTDQDLDEELADAARGTYPIAVSAQKPPPIIRTITAGRRSPTAPVSDDSEESAVFHLKLGNDKGVAIPITQALKSQWHTQFVKQNPTKSHRLKFATIMAMLIAAYEKGLADGRSKA